VSLLRATLVSTAGMGLLGVAYAVAAMSAPAAGAACFAILGFAAVAASTGTGGRAEASPEEGRAQGRAIGLLCLAALLLLAAVAVEHTLRFPDGSYDAWSIWNARARGLARGGSLADLLSPEVASVNFRTHLDYPLLLPGLVASGFRASASESPWVPALASIAFAASCLLVLGLTVARERSPAMGTLAALALATTPCFAGLAVSQVADPPLAAFAVCAAALLARAPAGEKPSLLLAGCMLSLAAWTKNEGLLFLVGFAASLTRARPRDAGFLAAGALPLCALLAWFKLGFAPPGDLLHSLVPLGELPSRAVLVATLALRHLVYFQDWGLHLAAAALALAGLAAQRRLPPASRLILRALCWVALGELCVYLLTPYDVRWHVQTSIDRLYFQLWPCALLALFLAFPAPPAPATGSFRQTPQAAPRPP
jgi:hypothetical protein